MNVSVVFTIDNLYVQPFLAATTSMTINSSSPIEIYIVYEQLSIRNISLIRLNFLFRKVKLHFLRISTEALQGLSITHHISVTTYFRLMLAKLLPATLDKIIFMDADIIVTGNISELFHTELKGAACAAVENPNITLGYLNKIGLKSESYFNAGVLLINLEYWRSQEVFEKSLEFLNERSHSLSLWDQDGLNYILEDFWIKLHPGWNLMHSYFLEEIFRSSYTGDEIRQAIESPCIVHYSGGGKIKPWDPHCDHQFRDLYYHYLLKSIWKIKFWLKR